MYVCVCGEPCHQESFSFVKHCRGPPGFRVPNRQVEAQCVAQASFGPVLLGAFSRGRAADVSESFRMKP